MRLKETVLIYCFSYNKPSSPYGHLSYMILQQRELKALNPVMVIYRKDSMTDMKIVFSLKILPFLLFCVLHFSFLSAIRKSYYAALYQPFYFQTWILGLMYLSPN